MIDNKNTLIRDEELQESSFVFGRCWRDRVLLVPHQDWGKYIRCHTASEIRLMAMMKQMHIPNSSASTSTVASGSCVVDACWRM
jgi:hypothetical protein